MPATSEKQRKFFGAVMGAKKGEKGPSGKAKKVAKEMPEKEIKKFLKKEEDEQSISKAMKKTGSVKIKGPDVKQRKHFAPPTKVEPPKKGKGSYVRDKGITESKDIASFIDCLLDKKFATANKYLARMVETKLQEKIKKELKSPLF